MFSSLKNSIRVKETDETLKRFTTPQLCLIPHKSPTCEDHFKSIKAANLQMRKNTDGISVMNYLIRFND